MKEIEVYLGLIKEFNNAILNELKEGGLTNKEVGEILLLNEIRTKNTLFLFSSLRGVENGRKIFDILWDNLCEKDYEKNGVKLVTLADSLAEYIKKA